MDLTTNCASMLPLARAGALIRRGLEPMNGGGSDPKFSNAEVCEALLQAKGIQSVAARILGCHRNTIRRYIQEEEDIAQAFGLTKDQNLDDAESNLLDALGRSEPWAIKFYLATQGRERGYGRTTEVKFPDGIPPARVSLELAEEVPYLAEVLGVLRDTGRLDRFLAQEAEADAGEDPDLIH